jgi:hypothetical protein
LDELRADPLFFAQDPRPVPGWTLGTPRPFKGGTVRTRWSRIGPLPYAPVQNLATFDGEVVEVPLRPEQVGQRKLTDLAFFGGLLASVGALVFAGWGREILIHNAYDAPIDVVIDGVQTHLEPHGTARSTIRFARTAEVSAQTADGRDLDRETLAPERHFNKGYTLWNPGGRGVYFIDSIIYGPGEPGEAELLSGQDVYEVGADWAFEPAPASIQLNVGSSALRERLMCLFDEPRLASDEAAASLGDLGLAELAPTMLRAELQAFPDNDRAAAALAGWLTAEETVAHYRDLHDRAPDAPWIQLRWQEVDPDRDAVRTAAAARREAHPTPINRLLWSAVDPDPTSARSHAEEGLAQLWADDPASAFAWLVVADARSRSGDDVGAAEAWAHVDDANHGALARWEATRLGLRVAPNTPQQGSSAEPTATAATTATAEPTATAATTATAAATATAETTESPAPADFDIQRRAAAVATDSSHLSTALAEAPSAFYRATLHRVAGDLGAARLALNELAPTERGWLYDSVLIELSEGGSETRLTTLLADTNPMVTAAQRRVLAAVARLVHAPTEADWIASADLIGDGGPTLTELLALDAAPANPDALRAWASRHHADAALALSVLARARGDAAARATWERAAVATADLSVLPHFAETP